MAVVPWQPKKNGDPSTPKRLDQVLDVAGRLFHERGYRSTSLSDIGEALGVNKASLYYYVKSKQDIARLLILRAAEGLRHVSSAADLDQMPARDALVRLIREHCAVILDHPHEMGLLIQQRRFLEPGALSAITERERRYAAHVRAVIARGTEDGSFRSVDPSVATQLTLDSVNSLLRWHRPDGRLTRETIIEEVCDFILNALGAGRSGRRKRS